MCPRLHNLFLSFWRHATMAPQRNCLLHDLISRVFLRSLQYGIVVLGFLDTFVYAHHKHRLHYANAGNFGDCMSGRVRFMTAITLAYAHAYQTICLGMPFPGVPHYSFRLPWPTSRYPFLPNDRSLSKELGHDYRGWAIFSDGGTRVVDGETVAGWRVISRSLVDKFTSCLVRSSLARNCNSQCPSCDDEFRSQIFRDHHLSKSIWSVLENLVMVLALQYHEHQ